VVLKLKKSSLNTITKSLVVLLLGIIAISFNPHAFSATDKAPIVSKFRIINDQSFELEFDDPTIIKFEGLISPESVSAFMVLHENSRARVVLLNSQGGDAEAAMELGHWILDRKLDVYPTICFSACANYLFLAGYNKLLRSTSKVLWHGGMHQKDEKEKYERNLKMVMSMTPQKLAKMTDSERLAFYRESELRRAYFRVRSMEDRFMARIRVNEYLFRLGQEPVWFDPDCWTANILVMKKLGVRNLIGPSDFGSVRHLDSTPLASLLCKGLPQTFELNTNGQIVASRAKRSSQISRISSPNIREQLK
jgi:hypothetical protein